jgi:hypothetical protein
MLFNFVKPTFIEETQRSQRYETIASDCSLLRSLRILKFDTLNLLNDVSNY